MGTEQPFHNDNSGRLDRIEARLQAIEAIMNQAIPQIERMDTDLYNHGQDGLKTQFTKFMADDLATKRTQKEMHQANTTRLNWIIALLALLCSILMVIIAFRGLAKTSEILTNPFHSRIPPIVLSSERR